jgi:hypothetical protein
VSPVVWSPCCPRAIQPPLTASPCGRLSRPRSTISQSDFHPIISPFSPHWLGRSYKLTLEPDGSPLFPLTPLVACRRYEPREHPRPLALARPAIPPSPLSDRVGYSDHVRFRGYLPVHWCSGLQPPCLRFAAAVTGRHARLGTRLLARLCRRRHLRRLSSTRLQGATLIEPDVRISLHPALGQDLTPSPTARRAQAGSDARARRSRKAAEVDSCRPCFVWSCA